MKAEKLIKELEYTRKKYEGKHVNTFETNIVAMIDDCISTVKELMPLATIGAATEKAFEDGAIISFPDKTPDNCTRGVIGGFDCNSTKQLMNLYERSCNL